MPRTARYAPAGMIFHVLNRGNARDEIFGKDADYAAFENILLETQEQAFVRILSYCLMPNHWHLVLWPLHDGDLGRFMQRLTTTHVRRWHLHHQTVGTGICIRERTSPFRSRPTITCIPYSDMSSVIPSDPHWWNEPKNGDGAAFSFGHTPPKSKVSPSSVPGQSPVRGIG